MWSLERLLQSYGTALLTNDLQPNIGLFWYYFTEIFTHFRVFFLFVFQYHLFIYFIPLTWRLKSVIITRSPLLFVRFNVANQIGITLSWSIGLSLLPWPYSKPILVLQTFLCICPCYHSSCTSCAVSISNAFPICYLTACLIQSCIMAL